MSNIKAVLMYRKLSDKAQPPLLPSYASNSQSCIDDCHKICIKRTVWISEKYLGFSLPEYFKMRTAFIPLNNLLLKNVFLNVFVDSEPRLVSLSQAFKISKQSYIWFYLLVRKCQFTFSSMEFFLLLVLGFFLPAKPSAPSSVLFAIKYAVYNKVKVFKLGTGEKI